MRELLVFCLCFAAVLSGCKKRPAPVAPAVQPATPPNPEKDLAELNLAVRAYYLSQGKRPATLDDLMQARCINRLPTAPAGKKYAIDAQKLEAVLVDQ
ncbi:MAG: hypothetical protein ACKODH_01850 [Limisphaerales bacterium]